MFNLHPVYTQTQLLSSESNSCNTDFYSFMTVAIAKALLSNFNRFYDLIITVCHNQSWSTVCVSILLTAYLNGVRSPLQDTHSQFWRIFCWFLSLTNFEVKKNLKIVVVLLTLKSSEVLWVLQQFTQSFIRKYFISVKFWKKCTALSRLNIIQSNQYTVVCISYWNDFWLLLAQRNAWHITSFKDKAIKATNSSASIHPWT